MDYLKLYNENADFKIYVDKYCVTYRVTVDVALSLKSRHFIPRIMLGREFP